MAWQTSCSVQWRPVAFFEYTSRSSTSTSNTPPPDEMSSTSASYRSFNVAASLAARGS